MKKIVCLFLSIVVVISSLTICVMAEENPEDSSADSAVDIVNQAIEKYNEGNLEECINLCQEAIIMDSSYIGAYEIISTAFYNLKQYDASIDMLKQILNLNPRNTLALYNSACAYSLLGDSDNAIKSLKDAILIDIKYKNIAIEDTDLDSIRSLDDFKKLTSVSIRIEGQLLEFEMAPVVKNDRTLLPMRTIFEELGAYVGWDDETQTATAVKNGKEVKLTIDSDIIKVNGNEIKIDVPPMLYKDKTMIPVRVIAESLDSKVDWDEENQVVNITSQMPVSDHNVDINQLKNLVEVLPIDGNWVEPYKLPVTEANCFIVAKEIKAIELFDQLSEDSKKEFMYNTTNSVYGDIVGCKPVHMYFVYDNDAYYIGDMSYDKKASDVSLTYFRRGMPVNVVKQDKEAFNYLDYYKFIKK